MWSRLRAPGTSPLSADTYPRLCSLRGCHSTFEEVIELQCLVEVRLRVQARPGKRAGRPRPRPTRLVQTVTDTAKQRESPAAVFERLFEQADADVDNHALYMKTCPRSSLGAPWPPGPARPAPRPGGRLAAEPVPNSTAPRSQMCNFPASPATAMARRRRCARRSGAQYSRNEADCAVGNRCRLRTSTSVREHYQRGRLGPQDDVEQPPPGHVRPPRATRRQLSTPWDQAFGQTPGLLGAIQLVAAGDAAGLVGQQRKLTGPSGRVRKWKQPSSSVSTFVVPPPVPQLDDGDLGQDSPCPHEVPGAGNFHLEQELARFEAQLADCPRARSHASQQVVVGE